MWDLSTVGVHTCDHLSAAIAPFRKTLTLKARTAACSLNCPQSHIFPVFSPAVFHADLFLCRSGDFNAFEMDGSQGLVSTSPSLLHLAPEDAETRGEGGGCYTAHGSADLPLLPEVREGGTPGPPGIASSPHLDGEVSLAWQLTV